MVGIVRASGITLLACGWLGCATPGASATPTVPTAELPAASAVPSEIAADEQAPAQATDPWQVEGLPPPLAPAGPVVCRLPAATPPDYVTGRLRAGGEKAFTAIGLEITLSLVKGNGPGSAFFRGSRAGLHMRGVMNRGDVRLFASEPLLMGGWLVPRHNAQLTVLHVGGESIDVGVDPKRLADVGMQNAPRESLSCKRLRADKADLFDPWAGLPPNLPARSG